MAGDHRVSEPVRVKISALGTYVPPRILSNADLEKMVETSNDWILERTGIRERHLVDKGVATSDLATEAGRRALAQRGIAASDLEAILVATVTPDMFFPSTACLVQHKLGAKGVWGFDLSAACSAFLYALQTGAQYVATGMHKKVMVIGVGRDVVDHRLHRPRHMCDLRRRRGCGHSRACRRRQRRPDRLCARGRRLGSAVPVYARRRQPESVLARDDREKDALRASGRAGGIQVCGAQANGTLRETSQAEWSAREQISMLSSRTRRIVGSSWPRRIVWACVRRASS